MTNNAQTIKKATLFSLLGLSLLLESFSLSSCAVPRRSRSYNVNVFDEAGNWYETGLLIKSNDKVYIKTSEGQFELIETEKGEKYSFEIDGKKLYVW